MTFNEYQQKLGNLNRLYNKQYPCLEYHETLRRIYALIEQYWVERGETPAGTEPAKRFLNPKVYDEHQRYRALMDDPSS